MTSIKHVEEDYIGGLRHIAFRKELGGVVERVFRNHQIFGVIGRRDVISGKGVVEVDDYTDLDRHDVAIEVNYIENYEPGNNDLGGRDFTIPWSTFVKAGRPLHMRRILTYKNADDE